MALKTIRLYPAGLFPLVLVTCRDCRDFTADCETCDNEGEVLVDEVFAADFVRDELALEAHLTAREAHFASIRAAQAARDTWPPRFPTPAEHAEIAALQAGYMGALKALVAPDRAA